MSPTSPLRSICIKHLKSLSETLNGVRMAVISSTDGFPIAMLDIDLATGRKAAAMSAALDGLCKTIVAEFSLGTLEGTVLEYKEGLALCRQVRSEKLNLVLLVIVDDHVTYGHALWRIKSVAHDVSLSIERL